MARQTIDADTTLGSGVDAASDRIETALVNQGNRISVSAPPLGP
jgi:hypothetical protein